MRKLYTLVAGLFLAGFSFGQFTPTVQVGDFEGDFYNGSAFGGTAMMGAYTPSGKTTLSWLGITTNETAAPLAGTQSANIANIEDSATAQVFSGTAAIPTDSLAGFIQQSYEGTFTDQDPNNWDVTLDYTYAPATGDTAVIRVLVMDTNVTANDGILYLGAGLLTPTATSTSKAIESWNNVQSGTANQLVISITSSRASFLNGSPAPQGSVLVVDNVVIAPKGGTPASVINENNVEYNVYPNPATTTLNIEIANENAKSISIYSVAGKLVKTVALNGNISSVNVADLNSGMYIYNIVTENGSVINSKFLKK